MTLSFDELVLAPCLNAFGEVNQAYAIPVYYPKNAGIFNLNGVFDDAYRENIIHDGLPVTVTMPVLGVRVSDCVVPPAPDDRVVIRGATYTVREVRDDGHGLLKLMLNVAENYEST